MRIIYPALFILRLIESITLFSQNFEGEVIFIASHKFTDSNLTTTPNLPSKMVYYISNEYVRIEQETQIGKQIVLFDTLSKIKTILINQNGENLAIQLLKEVDSNVSTKITDLNDSLKICDFSCYKILWNSYNEKLSTNSFAEIYCTDEIANGYMENFEKLPGFPLKYTLTSAGIESTYQAISVSKKQVDPSVFKLDKKIPKYTFEEFKSLMSQ